MKIVRSAAALLAPLALGVLASGCEDRRPLLEGTFLMPEPGHRAGIETVAFSLDGRFVYSAASDGAVKIWDMATGRPIHTMKGDGRVYGIALAADGRTVLLGGVDKTMKLRDVASGRLIRSFEGHREHVYNFAFAPDGQTVLSGSGDNTVKLWDIATGKVIHTFEGHQKHIFAVAYVPGGRMILSSSADRTAKLWDLASGKEIARLEGDAAASRITFGPGGRTALLGQSIYDLSSGKAIVTLEKDISASVLAPDGRTAVTGGAFPVVWDAASGKVIRTFEEGQSYPTGIVFSPDGRTVLSGSIDGTLMLRDADTGKLIRTFAAARPWLGYGSIALFVVTLLFCAFYQAAAERRAKPLMIAGEKPSRLRRFEAQYYGRAAYPLLRQRWRRYQMTGLSVLLLGAASLGFAIGPSPWVATGLVGVGLIMLLLGYTKVKGIGALQAAAPAN